MTGICFTCGKELDPVWEGSKSQYNDAMMFESHGNYGSTVFDPFDSRLSLLIQICDPCVVERKDRVIHVTTTRPLPECTFEPWEPGEEDTKNIPLPY